MRIWALIIASIAFALYVTCPRVTAMIVAESKITGLNPVLTIALGCILGIPMFLVMYYTLIRFGVEVTVILAALFDIGAALLIGKLSLKAGIELLIITAFVYVGIKLAPIISSNILKIW